MKKSAFTLMEILIAMSIIGVIAAATANNIKNVAANKTKQTFQNCYNHILQTVADIASDETIYPVVENISSVDSTGHFQKSSMCTLGINFPDAFVNRSKAINKGDVTGGFHFETPNGVYWVVKKQADNNSCQNSNFDKSNNADYVVLFDIDGPNEGNDCPYNITNIGSGSTDCAKPDTFLFGISANNEVIADNNSNIYNGKKLMQFMKDNNYLQTK